MFVSHTTDQDADTAVELDMCYDADTAVEPHVLHAMFVSHTTDQVRRAQHAG